MDQKIQLVIFLIQNLVIPKRDISNHHIKETVRQVYFLKSLHCYRRFLVKLLRNPAGNAVDLYPVYPTVRQTFRLHPCKIPCAAAWLQDVAGLKPHILQCLVHSTDHNRRCIKCRQGRLSCRLVFFFRQDNL